MGNTNQLRLFGEETQLIKPYTKKHAARVRAESIRKNLRESPDGLVFWK